MRLNTFNRKIAIKHGALSLIAVLFLAFSPTLTSSATTTQQTKAPAPIYVNVRNNDQGTQDIYQVNGGDLRRRTTDQGSNIPIISPDGTWIAYITTAKFTTTNADRTPAVNIAIQSIATAKERVVATQPDGATIEPENAKYVIRSQPAWSPSARQLAWTEILIDAANQESAEPRPEQLVVYDLDANTRRVIVGKLPDHRTTDGVPNLSELAWGLPGIAVVSHIPDPKKFPEQITVYAPDGTQLSQTEPLNDSGFQYSQVIWVQDGQRYYVSNVVGDYYIDPTTGKDVPFYPNLTVVLTPEAYSPLAPNGVSLFFGDRNVGEGNPIWLIAVNGEVKTEMASSGRYYYLSGFGISPDGKGAAYVVYPGQGTEGGLYIYRSGNKIRLSFNGVEGVAWGPIAWRIRKVNFGAG